MNSENLDLFSNFTVYGLVIDKTVNMVTVTGIKTRTSSALSVTYGVEGIL